MDLNIPKKNSNKQGVELFNHQCRLNEEKTKKFTRVREILGGYSSAELLEILIDKAIETYDDGQEPDFRLLPKQLKGGEE